MAKLNNPVDQLFRAGQISSKNWARLTMKSPGKGAKTHGRMADFDQKHHSDGRTAHGLPHSKRNHIDGPDQRTGAKGAFTQPTRGGFIRNASGASMDGAKTFPRQGSGRAPKAYAGQGPSSSNYPAKTKGGEQYGSKNSRPNAPSRLGRPPTRGSKF